MAIAGVSFGWSLIDWLIESILWSKGITWGFKIRKVCTRCVWTLLHVLGCWFLPKNLWSQKTCWFLLHLKCFWHVSGFVPCVIQCFYWIIVVDCFGRNDTSKNACLSVSVGFPAYGNAPVCCTWCTLVSYSNMKQQMCSFLPHHFIAVGIILTQHHHLAWQKCVSQGIANRSVTYVDWSNPNHGASPATLVVANITAKFFRKVQNRTENLDGQYIDSSDDYFSHATYTMQTCVYNGQPHSPCFLFARKFSGEAQDVAPFASIPATVLGYWQKQIKPYRVQLITNNITIISMRHHEHLRSHAQSTQSPDRLKNVTHCEGQVRGMSCRV